AITMPSFKIILWLSCEEISAYGINIKIYKSNLSNIAKVLLNLLTGLTAIILMLIAANLIRMYFL
ncbi:hypothetical protein ACVES1_19760, partial [Acinetobacter baumannii]